ncbi:hypothetical protein PPS11_39943 [Pseudomonas putida S11]|nr:hypothetical protein PPS11_39943 [Pseudomonas putida S11]
MKEWEVIFADQKGVLTTLTLRGDQCPTRRGRRAGRSVRTCSRSMDELDLNDFQDRTISPTARWLKEQSGVTITSIHETP